MAVQKRRPVPTMTGATLKNHVRFVLSRKQRAKIAEILQANSKHPSTDQESALVRIEGLGDRYRQESLKAALYPAPNVQRIAADRLASAAAEMVAAIGKLDIETRKRVARKTGGSDGRKTGLKWLGDYAARSQQLEKVAQYAGRRAQLKIGPGSPADVVLQAVFDELARIWVEETGRNFRVATNYEAGSRKTKKVGTERLFVSEVLGALGVELTADLRAEGKDKGELKDKLEKRLDHRLKEAGKSLKARYVASEDSEESEEDRFADDGR